MTQPLSNFSSLSTSPQRSNKLQCPKNKIFAYRTISALCFLVLIMIQTSTAQNFDIIHSYIEHMNQQMIKSATDTVYLYPEAQSANSIPPIDNQNRPRNDSPATINSSLPQQSYDPFAVKKESSYDGSQNYSTESQGGNSKQYYRNVEQSHQQVKSKNSSDNSHQIVNNPFSQPFYSHHKNNSNSGSTQSNLTSYPSSPTQSFSPNPSQPLPQYVQSQTNCRLIKNSYWTGSRCACRVGFKNITNNIFPLIDQNNQIVNIPNRSSQQYSYQNQCVPFTYNPKPKPPIHNHTCYQMYEYFNGIKCVCLDGYQREESKSSFGSIKKCVKKNNINLNNNQTCPLNSYQNYQYQQQQHSGNQSCLCKQGYNRYPYDYHKEGTISHYNFDFYCAKCPNGALWVSNIEQCVWVCGQRAEYNLKQKKCQCLPGYGYYRESQCQVCPSGTFLKNGYCVKCPVNSNYDKILNRCECHPGFYMSIYGHCKSTCESPHEYFDPLTQTCKCQSGLGKLPSLPNAQCQICPPTTVPTNDGLCQSCGLNEVSQEEKCVCKEDFIKNEWGVCTFCQDVIGHFFLQNHGERLCAKCPGQLQLINGKCSCGKGQLRKGSQCISLCQWDELVDSRGFCYKCPINQVIKIAKDSGLAHTYNESFCECKRGYERNLYTGLCQLKCTKPGSFPYKDRCAQCPLNLEYRPEIKGCACPIGTYLTLKGVCQIMVFPPISCPSGEYFKSSKGCISCPSDCSTCNSEGQCTQCKSEGYVLNHLKQCAPKCGDGLIAGVEKCDDHNILSGDGCSNKCQTQQYFTCYGQPSKCQYNGPVTEQLCGNGKLELPQKCDDGNTKSFDGCSNGCLVEDGFNCTAVINRKSVCYKIQGNDSNLKLYSDVNTNANNVYIVLQTHKPFIFENENEMQNFIKTDFPNSDIRPMVYCIQREADEKDLFDCLLVYASGLPNHKYTVDFSYDYKGEQGEVKVDVNPFKTKFAMRSLRRGRSQR